jgi:phospholipase A1
MLKIILLTASMFVLSIGVKSQYLNKYNWPQMLEERWQTDSSDVHESFLITPYKPIYFLLGNYYLDHNEAPKSLNPAYQVPDSNAVPLANVEFKFQISFKFKLIKGLFWGYGDLWAAYSQTSRWQLYNSELSRAFRETNYEPELILNFKTNYHLLGLKGKVAGISMVHQSNGRNLPLSRSWNRIVGHVGLQRYRTEIMLKAWYRLTDTDDENPQAVDYIGRAEALVAHQWKGHQLSFTARNNLNLNNNRGSLQVDWGFPLYGRLKGHAQIFHGYGESLIDYNYLHTSFGLGINLINWL